VVLKEGGIALFGAILRGRGSKKAKGEKTLNHYHLSIIELTSVVTLMLSKQRNCLLIHKQGYLRLYLTKMSPNV